MSRTGIFRFVLLTFCVAAINMNMSAQSWDKVADGMAQSLLSKFWGASFEGHSDRYYFNYESDMANMGTGHYWPQAHAMDVLVDAYMRTGDEVYKELFPLWWDGMPRFNFACDLNPEDRWWNVFVDDMEWIALAQIRMWECTGEKKYIDKARQTYDRWIWSTWGPENEWPWFGGITWKTDVAKSKNACSNGPAALLAARFCRFYNEAGFNDGKSQMAYLQEAVKIYAWEKHYLFDNKTGAVYDNIAADGKVDRRGLYTYNSGTFIGAAHELYLLTGDRQYLDDAVLAAKYVMKHMTSHGTLCDDTYGDGGLFHGIFFRYFVKLINEEALDVKVRKEFSEYLTSLAETMVQHGLNHNTMLYGGSWKKAPTDDQPVCLTAHLTGCMLVEAMCILKPIE